MAIIGIVGRRYEEEKWLNHGNNIGYDYINKLMEHNNSVIGLITSNDFKQIDEKVLDMCDAILIPGGSEIKEYHFHLIDYCVKNNIPLLGICLGMQAIAIYSDRTNGLQKVSHHCPANLENKEKVLEFKHEISIKEDSLLHKLYKDTLTVNSRHNYAVKNVKEPFKITATCDGVIEALELVNDNQFIVGVQFHPEVTNEVDELFKAFTNRANKKRKNY